jgi:hypothetical protein
MKKKKKNNSHTSLREEGAEAVVGVGLLALLSEESIGLSTSLVPLKKIGVRLPESTLGAPHEFDLHSNIPGYRAPDSTARKS